VLTSRAATQPGLPSMQHTTSQSPASLRPTNANRLPALNWPVMGKSVPGPNRTLSESLCTSTNGVGAVWIIGAGVAVG
jgi:hypothetical protein